MSTVTMAVHFLHGGGCEKKESKVGNVRVNLCTNSTKWKVNTIYYLDRALSRLQKMKIDLQNWQ